MALVDWIRNSRQLCASLQLSRTRHWLWACPEAGLHHVTCVAPRRVQVTVLIAHMQDAEATGVGASLWRCTYQGVVYTYWGAPSRSAPPRRTGAVSFKYLAPISGRLWYA